MPIRLHRRRNPVAQAEILRKGGVHEKSKKAKRRESKQKLRKEVNKAMATFSGHFFVWFLRNGNFDSCIQASFDRRFRYLIHNLTC